MTIDNYEQGMERRRMTIDNYEQGWKDGMAEASTILQHLIERLRAGDPTFGDEPPLWVKTALYNAEHRLRKVSSE